MGDLGASTTDVEYSLFQTTFFNSNWQLLMGWVEERMLTIWISCQTKPLKVFLSRMAPPSTQWDFYQNQLLQLRRIGKDILGDLHG